jgi:hypothetical protein
MTRWQAEQYQKMNDYQKEQFALYHYNRMMEVFKHCPPTPDHYPQIFQYYVTLYKNYYLVDSSKES